MCCDLLGNRAESRSALDPLHPFLCHCGGLQRDCRLTTVINDIKLIVWQVKEQTGGSASEGVLTENRCGAKMSGRAAIEAMFNPGFVIKARTGLHNTKAAIKGCSKDFMRH